MDVRRIGLITMGAGAAALVAGVGIDAWLHASDPSLARREALLTLGNAGHPVAALGIGALLLGLAAMLAGPRLYAPSGDERPGRRLLQLSAPLAALALLAGSAFAANASNPGAAGDQDLVVGSTAPAGQDMGAPGHDHAAMAGDGHDHEHSATAGADPSHEGHAEGEHEMAAGATGDVHGHGAAATGAHADHDMGAPGHDHAAMLAAGHAHDAAPGTDPHAGHDPATDPGGHEHGTNPGADPGTDPHAGHDPATDPHAGHDPATDPGGHGHTDPGTDPGTDPHGDHDPGGEACTNGGHGHDAGPPEPLSASEQIALEAQLAATRAYALRFPTAADAKKAGYNQVTHYICGIGAHYMKFSLLDDVFDPAAPEILLYDWDGPDAKLVGVNFYVSRIGQAPDGYVGPNDNWHRHLGLCLRIFFVIGPDTLTEEECKARGGYKQPNSDRYWLLHAWVVPGYEHPTDVFAPTLPALPPGPWDGEGISF